MWVELMAQMWGKRWVQESAQSRVEYLAIEKAQNLEIMLAQ